MPQCVKCGREINDYGLCAECADKARKAAGIVYGYEGVSCPNCGGSCCEPIDRDTFRCCDCDCEFSDDED